VSVNPSPKEKKAHCKSIGAINELPSFMPPSQKLFTGNVCEVNEPVLILTPALYNSTSVDDLLVPVIKDVNVELPYI
jgi:hypothetical protein